jgi:hypothetical protein
MEEIGVCPQFPRLPTPLVCPDFHTLLIPRTGESSERYAADKRHF